MTKLILSTGNIVSGGPSIIRKPGAYRSNLELTNSLRSSFLAAQQAHSHPHSPTGSGSASPIPSEPSAAARPPSATPNNFTNGHTTDTNHQSSTTTSSTATTSPSPSFPSTPRNGASSSLSSTGISNGALSARRPPLSAWTSRSADGSTLYIPHLNSEDAEAGLQEEASQYDITVKLFFLPAATPAERREHAAEAMSLIQGELGASVSRVDLLIASFPGMSFPGDCEWEADSLNATQGNLDDEADTWRALEELHRSGAVARLGIAEFGSDKLRRFLDRVSVAPAVDQINIRNCCNVPPPLAQLAKERNIDLLVHTDCVDILPEGTLRDLLGSGFQGAGVLAGPGTDAEDSADPDDEAPLKGDLRPLWVAKYTAVVKDRGVIENKGYFAAAELVDG